MHVNKLVVKTIFAILLATLAGAAVYYADRTGFFAVKQAKKSVETVKSVRIVTVEMQNTGITLPLVGRVKANRSLVITPEVTARVSKVAVKSTQEVKSGQLLIKLEDAREQARLNEAEVILNNELHHQKLVRTLRKKGVVSQDAFEQLEAEVEKQRAIVDAKRAELANYSIYAPFSGVLGLHQVTVGQLVKPGNVLLQLDDISRVFVDFQVPERFLSNILIGQEVTAVTDAWPGQSFGGRIEEIDTHVDSNTLAVKVRVYFENPKHRLLDGMMIQMRLLLSASQHPVIPLKAINYLGDERFVFVLKKDGTVTKRRIVIGTVNGSQVAIKDGLRAGMQIVSEGGERINDGDKVQIIKDRDELDMSGENPLKKKDRRNREDLVL